MTKLCRAELEILVRLFNSHILRIDNMRGLIGESADANRALVMSLRKKGVRIHNLHGAGVYWLDDDYKGGNK